jgi:hypothetical protein
LTHLDARTRRFLRNHERFFHMMDQSRLARVLGKSIDRRRDK